MSPRREISSGSVKQAPADEEVHPPTRDDDAISAADAVDASVPHVDDFPPPATGRRETTPPRGRGQLHHGGPSRPSGASTPEHQSPPRAGSWGRGKAPMVGPPTRANTSRGRWPGRGRAFPPPDRSRHAPPPSDDDYFRFAMHEYADHLSRVMGRHTDPIPYPPIPRYDLYRADRVHDRLPGRYDEGATYGADDTYLDHRYDDPPRFRGQQPWQRTPQDVRMTRRHEHYDNLDR